LLESGQSYQLQAKLQLQAKPQLQAKLQLQASPHFRAKCNFKETLNTSQLFEPQLVRKGNMTTMSILKKNILFKYKNNPQTKKKQDWMWKHSWRMLLQYGYSIKKGRNKNIVVVMYLH
jgi:hypothetical protein